MITKKQMFGVRCDNCQEDFVSVNGFIAMTEKEHMENEAIDSDWIVEKNKCSVLHLCPDCFSFDDNDEIQINPERRKEAING